VSFLGFEALLARLDRDAVRVSPSGKTRWVKVDGSGNAHGHRTVGVVPDDRTWALTIDGRDEGRMGDRRVVHCEAEVSAEAPFAVRSWMLESSVQDAHGQVRPQTRRLSGGRVRSGRLKLEGTAMPPPALSSRPAVLGWSMGLLAEHDHTLDSPPLRFLDLFDEGWSLARKVRWQAVGKVMWEGAALRGWRMMGPDWSPRHIWTGPSGAAIIELSMGSAWVRASLLGGRG